VPFVAQQIAQVRQLPVETIARATSDNFEALFAGVNT
jgi:TatD DNase family protein